MPSTRESEPGYREYVLDRAVRAGKFPASRKPHYRRLYDKDPAATRALIGQLASGLPPAAHRQDEGGLPDEWFPAGGRNRKPSTAVALEAKEGGLPVEWGFRRSRARQGRVTSADDQG
jgi:hypothetical protein